MEYGFFDFNNNGFKASVKTMGPVTLVWKVRSMMLLRSPSVGARERENCQTDGKNFCSKTVDETYRFRRY